MQANIFEIVAFHCKYFKVKRIFNQYSYFIGSTFLSKCNTDAILGFQIDLTNVDLLLVH